MTNTLPEPETCPHCGGQLHIEVSVEECTQPKYCQAYAVVESIAKWEDWLEKERERLTLQFRSYEGASNWTREHLAKVEKALAEIKKGG